MTRRALLRAALTYVEAGWPIVPGATPYGSSAAGRKCSAPPGQCQWHVPLWSAGMLVTRRTPPGSRLAAPRDHRSRRRPVLVGQRRRDRAEHRPRLRRHLRRLVGPPPGRLPRPGPPARRHRAVRPHRDGPHRALAPVHRTRHAGRDSAGPARPGRAAPGRQPVRPRATLHPRRPSATTPGSPPPPAPTLATDRRRTDPRRRTTPPPPNHPRASNEAVTQAGRWRASNQSGSLRLVGRPGAPPAASAPSNLEGYSQAHPVELEGDDARHRLDGWRRSRGAAMKGTVGLCTEGRQIRYAQTWPLGRIMLDRLSRYAPTRMGDPPCRRFRPKPLTGRPIGSSIRTMLGL